MKGKNILVINDIFAPNSAGAETLAVAIASKLATRGHQVTFCACYGTRERYQVYKSIDVYVFQDEPIRFSNLTTIYNKTALQKLTEFLKDRFFDVCLINSVHSGFSYAALALLKRYVGQCVHIMHDITGLTYGGYVGFADPSLKRADEIDFKITTASLIKQYGIKVMPFRNSIIKRMLRQVDKIVAVSSVHERVLNANGIFNTTVIHPGVESANFQSVSHPSNCHYEFRILFAGRATIGKGLIPLLEMARNLKANDKFQIRITASREGELAALLDRQYADLENCIFCEGWQDKASLSKLYSSCDILISPSVAFETFCLVNLEAGLHGTPVISSIYGGPVDYVIDGYNGYLVNPVDTNCLTDRVLRFMSDENLVRTMGANNRLRACEFSLDRAIDSYESLLFDNKTQKEVSVR